MMNILNVGTFEFSCFELNSQASVKKLDFTKEGQSNHQIRDSKFSCGRAFSSLKKVMSIFSCTRRKKNKGIMKNS